MTKGEPKYWPYIFFSSRIGMNLTFDQTDGTVSDLEMDWRFRVRGFPDTVESNPPDGFKKNGNFPCMNTQRVAGRLTGSFKHTTSTAAGGGEAVSIRPVPT